MYMICQFVFYMLYSISIFSRPEKGRTKARNLFLRDLHRPLSINFCLYSSIPATSVFFYGHHCAKSFEADFRKLCWRPTYLQFLEQYISISLAAGALLVLKKIYIYIYICISTCTTYTQYHPIPKMLSTVVPLASSH